MKQETKRRAAACAAGFVLPRYEEIPQVGLYLDQTVKYVNGFYLPFPCVELTPSMVSNYVKQGLIGHPVKKKYTRDQLASLLYIAAAKTVLSIENIEMLFQVQRAHCTMAVAYEAFRCELGRCLPYVFGLSTVLEPLPADAADERFLMRSAMLAAANKLYLDCCLTALRQEEAFWPGILPDLA